MDNEGVYKGGFEAGFAMAPPEELELKETAAEMDAYVAWQAGFQWIYNVLYSRF